MKLFNKSISVVSIFIVVVLLGITVYATINFNFSVASQIIFNSNAFYKVEANAYMLSEDLYESFDNLEELIKKETVATQPFIQNFSKTEPTTVTWIIPYNTLKFKTSKKYIVYAFKIENHSDSEVIANIFFQTFILTLTLINFYKTPHLCH